MSKSSAVRRSGRSILAGQWAADGSFVESASRIGLAENGHSHPVLFRLSLIYPWKWINRTIFTPSRGRSATACWRMGVASLSPRCRVTEAW
ncbi:hypothetical protein [Sphingobium yanoikuyae]